MSAPRVSRTIGVALLLLTASNALRGQPSAIRDSLAHPLPVPAIALWFAAGTLAATPLDGRWDRAIGGAGPQRSNLLREFDRVGDNWGSPGAIVAAGTLWLGARVLHDSVRARLGARALEALALSGIVTGGIKGLAGRARPYADPGNPDSWVFARGIRDDRYQSFPSGHATAAFAFASAIAAQLDRDRSPIARWAGPALYALAGVTAFARTSDHAHWISDVAAGAGVGTLSGLTVVRWHDAHRTSWIDRILLGR
jgi:membrane-associated phospholipid phosphatase